MMEKKKIRITILRCFSKSSVSFSTTDFIVNIERAWATNKCPRPGDNRSSSVEFSIVSNARSPYSVFNWVWTRFATSSLDKPNSTCSSEIKKRKKD